MDNMFHDPPQWDGFVGQSRNPSDEHTAYFGEHIKGCTTDSFEDHDVVLVGEPYDRGHVMGRPGARNGPEAIRETLANTKTFRLDGGSVTLDVGDLGNVHVPEGVSNRSAERHLQNVASELHSAKTIPIFLGGDHSLASPNISPLFDQYDSVGVINLDSHDDLMEQFNNQPHTASPFRDLYEQSPYVYVILGARQFGLTEKSFEFLQEMGGMAIPADKVAKDIELALSEAFAAMEDVEAIYLSVDIDVLDMGFTPGTSSPYPGGLQPRELFEIVNQIAKEERIVGMEIVECLPLIDHGNITATNAGRTVAHFLSGLQSNPAIEN